MTVKIALFVEKGLRAAGYAVDHAPDGETGLQLALTEPFAFSELLARVQALIRRSCGLAEPTQLVVGNLIMNLLSILATDASTGESRELVGRVFPWYTPCPMLCFSIGPSFKTTKTAMSCVPPHLLQRANVL
jgi:DNA-binding response OmpR family regulator